MVLFALSFLSTAVKSQVAKNFSYSIYGEVHYNDIVQDAQGPATKGELDFHKAFFKAGYKFSKNISVTTRLRVEHLFDEHYNNGDAFIDQAYLSYKLSPEFNIKAGVIPVLLNAGKSKPYGTVETSPVEKYLAFTWREAGVEFNGTFENSFSYKVAFTTGLDASEIQAKSGIFSARNSEFTSSLSNLAAGVQFKYKPIYGMTVGTSALWSGLENGDGYGESLKGADYKVAEGFVSYKYHDITTRVVGVYSTISEVEKINAVVGNKIGSSQYGLLGEIGYDFHELFSLTKYEEHFLVFVRAASYDTKFRTSGITDDPDYERYEYSLGLVYKPVKFLELKADYQLLRSRGDRDLQQFDISLGYKF